jgi:hypothetical protein
MAFRKAISNTYKYFKLQNQKQRALSYIKRYRKRIDKYKKAHQERVKKSDEKRKRQSKTYEQAIANINKNVAKWNAELKKL